MSLLSLIDADGIEWRINEKTPVQVRLGADAASSWKRDSWEMHLLTYFPDSAASRAEEGGGGRKGEGGGRGGGRRMAWQPLELSLAPDQRCYSPFYELRPLKLVLTHDPAGRGFRWHWLHRWQVMMTGSSGVSFCRTLHDECGIYDPRLLVPRTAALVCFLMLIWLRSIHTWIQCTSAAL